jgi:hypothetical protein
MIDADLFASIVNELTIAGFAEDDIEWSENCGPPQHPDSFASEAIFVICNSGMKNTVARMIFDRIMPVVSAGGSATSGFGHKGKVAAIDTIWRDRCALFTAYLYAEDKVEFCCSLPWIGDITKYHLAKNFGVQVAKPDVHLQRLAEREGTTSQALCERLAEVSGYKVATVDLLLWRACAIGVIDSPTGRFTPWRPPVGQARLFDGGAA